ncbi:MAG: plastocyanin/azurin family copper-binding protein [Gemmatimonadaceae bacterium]
MGRHTRRRANATVIAFSAFLLAGVVSCSGGGGGGDANSSGYPSDPTGGSSGTGGTVNHSLEVGVVNVMYTPDATTVPKGSTVVWTWNSCDAGYNGAEVCTTHSVTFDDGVTSGTQDHGSFSRTFNTPGTYKYHCQVHGTAMAGSVVVQ